MDAILLPSDLQVAVSQIAEQEAKSVEEVLHEAVRHYQRELNREKLKREIAAYETMHGQLKEKFFGEWVAVHEGQLVDHDSDRAMLYARVRQHYGSLSILIREVAEMPAPDLWLRTPTTGNSEP